MSEWNTDLLKVEQDKHQLGTWNRTSERLPDTDRLVELDDGGPLGVTVFAELIPSTHRYPSSWKFISGEVRSLDKYPYWHYVERAKPLMRLYGGALVQEGLLPKTTKECGK